MPKRGPRVDKMRGLERAVCFTVETVKLFCEQVLFHSPLMIFAVLFFGIVVAVMEVYQAKPYIWLPIFWQVLYALLYGAWVLAIAGFIVGRSGETIKYSYEVIGDEEGRTDTLTDQFVGNSGIFVTVTLLVGVGVAFFVFKLNLLIVLLLAIVQCLGLFTKSLKTIAPFAMQILAPVLIFFGILLYAICGQG
ncbi:MAG: hypothetical protein M1352_03585 [Patescibacteria group bacterium]|nr:hypothetical protein [Patescibacteria group bacterium]